jgi:hypothetical protein
LEIGFDLFQVDLCVIDDIGSAARLENATKNHANGDGQQFKQIIVRKKKKKAKYGRGGDTDELGLDATGVNGKDAAMFCTAYEYYGYSLMIHTTG